MTATDSFAPTPPTLLPDAGEVESSGSALGRFARTFAENKLAVVGLAVIVAIVIFCFGGPIVYHSDQLVVNLLLNDGNSSVNAVPQATRPLGADNAGFDILGRLMKGGQISLEIGFLAGLFSTVIGVVYGALSGFFGKWVDIILMRVVDVILAFPIVFLFIYISTVEKPSEGLLILLLSIISWVVPARLVRGETLSIKTREYVQAMRTMGGTPLRAITRHIIPNTIGTIVVTITFSIADAILVLSTLQFFGFGLPPDDPTWGGMLDTAINSASAQINGYWWQIYPAGIAIVLTVVAVNLIGDALRDAFEVRLQKR